MARHPLPVRRLVLPPIRTVTVGIGVSPIQPQGRTSRVADCHRRFGFSPTPEHVCLAPSMPLRGVDVHHEGRTWLSPRGDFGGVPDPGHPSWQFWHRATDLPRVSAVAATSALAHGAGRGQELEDGGGDRGLGDGDGKDQGPAGGVRKDQDKRTRTSRISGVAADPPGWSARPPRPRRCRRGPPCPLDSQGRRPSPDAEWRWSASSSPRHGWSSWCG